MFNANRKTIWKQLRRMISRKPKVYLPILITKFPNWVCTNTMCVYCIYIYIYNYWETYLFSKQNLSFLFFDELYKVKTVFCSSRILKNIFTDYL